MVLRNLLPGFAVNSEEFVDSSRNFCVLKSLEKSCHDSLRDLASAHLVAGEDSEDAVVLLEAVAPREHVGQIYPQTLRHQLQLL